MSASAQACRPAAAAESPLFKRCWRAAGGLNELHKSMVYLRDNQCRGEWFLEVQCSSLLPKPLSGPCVLVRPGHFAHNSQERGEARVRRAMGRTTTIAKKSTGAIEVVENW